MIGILAGLCCVWGALAQTAEVEVNFAESSGPMQINRMALGQGGLSELPMWDNRIPEIRALKPAVIRLFIQEYFGLMPERGRYNFETLDRSVETILKTGATPLMCICFKPHALFPKLNQDIVEPEDYGEWEKLIYALVAHYQEKKAGIRYWEIANEPDIGEDGGCPYRFKPESYTRYYKSTVSAIIRADPEARVGGPALAGVRSAILQALLDFCQSNTIPLHFISWHIYSSSPKSIHDTVVYAKELLKRYPALNPETFLDEWNMDLLNPPLDPRFQPCFALETIWGMKEAGLDYSCYYHIRDYYVSFDTFAPFMSAQGTAFMTRWWNRMPQFDGLFDYQDQVRPAYFAFKLLSRLAGERLHVNTTNTNLRGFASHDEQLRMYNLLLWNFSASSVTVDLKFSGMPKDMRTRHISLDATTSSNDENQRLRPEPFVTLKQNASQTVTFPPYAIHYWSFE